MGGILVGVLATVRGAHQIQDLIIVVLPVCPVQAQSRRCFWVIASGNCQIGMTGLTSWAEGPDLEPFRRLKFFCGRKKPAIMAGFQSPALEGTQAIDLHRDITLDDF
ncbi:hypothetical protein FHW68_004253 [Pseudomonas sp. Tn43]|uniref:hypothetical protein n=1 Tax=Pseudomonas sp. Tn43 TaxID=701213 RepID=UPI000BAB4FE3|nr:hypothetical protein [Pseudomonas sp. Tn43]MBB3242703.1 hypothetical protein [Pseudomonas sp. Tn43]PAU56722.1 hypothetical protein BZL43_16255 [Pseudomonas sp. PICF141]